MKIKCWEDIENIILTKNGNFRDIVKKKTYYLKECKQCGEEYLGSKKSEFCSSKCSTSYRWKDEDSKFNSKETREKIGNSVKELWNDPDYKNNCINKIKELWDDPDSKYNSKETRNKYSERNKRQWEDPNSTFNSKEYRRNLSEKTILNRSDTNSAYNTDEYRENVSKSLKKAYEENPKFKIKLTGKNNSSWKGGYNKNNLPFYDTYAHQLEWCEEVRRNEQDSNVLEVRCFKCKMWYIPTLINVRNRIQVLKGNYIGINNFYCSQECKNSCSVFGKSAEILMKEDAIRAGRSIWLEMGREVQPELRKMVIERDGYICQKCGATENIQCHHIYPVADNPLESADLDNCITYCYYCHYEAHQKEGCRYGELETCIEYGKE